LRLRTAEEPEDHDKRNRQGDERKCEDREDVNHQIWTTQDPQLTC
jgi:hypothetical protein